MTGRYPNWGGNAGYWDNNAAATTGTDWTVSSVARPRSLFVIQPTSSNPAGHVGYVSDARVSSGVVQIRISDRNWNASCKDGTQPVYDRTNVWINVATTMRFIVPPPAGAI
jgi:surface antigen